MKQHTPRSLSGLARGLALLLALLPLAACSGSSSSVGGGGTVPPPGGDAGSTFAIQDLEGDWVGQLTPDAANVRNFYLRFQNATLVSAAESGGLDWTALDSDRDFQFTADGRLAATMALQLGSGSMSLSGQMDESRAVLTGTFRLTDADGQRISGSFSLVRSSGPDMYVQAQLEGPWDGLGRNGLGKFRFLSLVLDADGLVSSGTMLHPETEVLIRTYSAAAGAFSFSDTAVGRLDDVVITADSGETITFDFLLLDPDATLLAGPGVESALGAGIAELVRP